MRLRFAFLLPFALALVAVMPGFGGAASATQTYELHMEAPNIGVAANGDRVLVEGGGTFSVHPKSVEASGPFTHTDSEGNVLGGGTWTATTLLSFQSYGCRFIPALDVDLGDDTLCGGKLKMRVRLDTPIGAFPGILTVFCIVGPKAPASHNTPPGEGVTLTIPGAINFNHTGGGENIYIRTN
jgi:hypothetical protein